MPSEESVRIAAPAETTFLDQSRWEWIESCLSQTYEEERPRLEEEASWMEIELPPLWALLGRIPVSEKLRLFEERNPQLDMNRLEMVDRYQVAVGVLRMFTEE